MTETTPLDFMNGVECVVIWFLGKHLNNKVQLGLICEVNRLSLMTGAELDVQPSNFRSNQESIYEATNLGEVHSMIRTRILESFDTYLKRGSDFTHKAVLRLEITLSRLNLLCGLSYLPLPKWTRDKKAITNMKNEDNFCFK